MLGNFACTFAAFFKINFFEKLFQEIPSLSNSPDLDQTQCFVRPDLDPNCLQKLPADNTSRQLNCMTVTNWEPAAHKVLKSV